jgi:hypothetical protein
MNVSTEPIREFDSEEDRKLLVSLLEEYSEKLSILCDKLETHRARKKNYLLLMVGTILIVAAVSFVRFNGSAEDLPRMIIFIAALIAAPSYGVLLISTQNLERRFSKIRFLLPIDRKDERFVRDIKRLSKKLEKVVQIVSQIQEHLPRHISIRIEMDFRLTDAELVLERSILYAGLAHER